MEACPHPFPFDARCLSFGWDVLKCACGGTRTLIAAVKKPAEIERFLRYLQLWANADERGQVLPISCSKKLAIPTPPVHGPPKVFDIEEFERQADWDDFYESEDLMKAHAENWAA